MGVLITVKIVQLYGLNPIYLIRYSRKCKIFTDTCSLTLAVKWHDNGLVFGNTIKIHYFCSSQRCSSSALTTNVFPKHHHTTLHAGMLQYPLLPHMQQVGLHVTSCRASQGLSMPTHLFLFPPQWTILPFYSVLLGRIYQQTVGSAYTLWHLELWLTNARVLIDQHRVT